MEEKIKKEIKNLLHELSENDPRAFEDAIDLKTRIMTLVDVLTL